MVNTFTIGPKLKWIKKLDYKRLGKQRVEAKQIIDILEYYDENGEMPDAGWTNHKVTKMWIGHTKALKVYFNYVVRQWVKRGYKNNYEYYDVEDCEIIECKFDGTRAKFSKKADENTFPIWYSFPPFYLSQRAALIMKEKDYYEDIFLDDEVEPYMYKGYLWPSDYGKEIYKNWSLDYLAELGSGIPPQYRISKKIIKKWLKDKNTNPETGRSITKTGQIYKDYKKAAKELGML